jgi:hypothetical protein
MHECDYQFRCLLVYLAEVGTKVEVRTDKKWLVPQTIVLFRFLYRLCHSPNE